MLHVKTQCMFLHMSANSYDGDNNDGDNNDGDNDDNNVDHELCSSNLEL